MITRWPEGFTSVSKAAPQDPLATLAEKLASQYEPKIVAAVANLLQTQAGALDLDALVEALTTGDAGKVMAVINTAMGAAPKGVVVNALQDAVWGAGAAAVIQLAAPGTQPELRAVEFHFDRLNPTLVRWLQSYELDLIKQIDAGTKESIRDILVEQMLRGDGPQKAASRIKEVIGLTKRQANAVGAYRKELETFHLKRTAAGWNLGNKVDMVNGHPVFKPGPDGDPKDGVLERRLRDFRYDKQLIKALETRKPLKPEQIDKMVAAYARKYRMYRARTIARTESLRSTNVGVQEAFRQAIESGKLAEDVLRRFWIVAKDERLCKVCEPIPGMNETGVAFAQPFASVTGPVMLPPIHPQCRCTVFTRWVGKKSAS